MEAVCWLFKDVIRAKIIEAEELTKIEEGDLADMLAGFMADISLYSIRKSKRLLRTLILTALYRYTRDDLFHT